MSDYKETKEAYLKVPETDIAKRSSLIKKLIDLAGTSEELKDFFKLAGQFEKYLRPSMQNVEIRP
jgi:hypothetical protein